LGKPFSRELENIPLTLKWAFEVPIDPSLERIVNSLSGLPLLVVGSGGSLSCAHFIARIHEKATGRMSRAITPLEFLFLEIDPSFHAVLFITASGKNKDIIDAFEIALEKEFAPSFIQELIEAKPNFETPNCDNILNRNTIVALGGEWAWPAFIDLESKFTEAGLRNVLITDLRNFGHGRHNWFDKKGRESALLILETPALERLSKQIITLLPEQFPSFILRTTFQGPLAGIDLLKHVFYLVNRAGIISNIDPGRPQVPIFGRKIYHVGLRSTRHIKKGNNRNIWIERKVRASHHSRSIVEISLTQFLDTVRHTKFAGVVLDYDGTLCYPPERFEKPRSEIASALNRLLSEGISIGIASGRGQSVQKSLQQVIIKTYWHKVLVGNYNGSIVTQLSDNLPKVCKTTSIPIKEALQVIQSNKHLMDHIDMEVRTKQISVSSKIFHHKPFLFCELSEMLSKLENIKIVQSSHSIDIIDKSVSKIQVIKALKELLPPENSNILVIGDQGQYGGNDFEMLDMPCSFSVDKTSSSLINCWNLSPIGECGANATVFIIKSMRIENALLQLDIDYLERVNK
jgi:HAD superfamily hydrolase (TIGR01484 family)